MMFGWAVLFFLLAVGAAYLGFFALVGLAAILSKLFLIVFAMLLIVSAFSGVLRRRPPVSRRDKLQ